MVLHGMKKRTQFVAQMIRELTEYAAERIAESPGARPIGAVGDEDDQPANEVGANRFEGTSGRWTEAGGVKPRNLQEQQASRKDQGEAALAKSSSRQC